MSLIASVACGAAVAVTGSSLATRAGAAVISARSAISSAASRPVYSAIQAYVKLKAPPRLTAPPAASGAPRVVSGGQGMMANSARTLVEKQALASYSNALDSGLRVGRVIMGPGTNKALGDPRYQPPWVKMEVGKFESGLDRVLHYMYNPETGQWAQLKFVD